MVRMLSSSSVIPSAPGFLVLRVRGSTRDGQVVRLQSPKCTIGSGPNCTLRLRADNIGAVHCLILRGPSRTVVRRWSPDTRLNGRNFTESVLQAGDCLSIGAIDLEVVETAQPGLPSEDLRDQQQTIDQQLAADRGPPSFAGRTTGRMRRAAGGFSGQAVRTGQRFGPSGSRSRPNRASSGMPARRNSRTVWPSCKIPIPGWKTSVRHGRPIVSKRKSAIRPRPNNWLRGKRIFNGRGLPSSNSRLPAKQCKASTQQQLADRAAVLESTIADFQSRATTLEEDCRQWELIRSEQAADLDVARACAGRRARRLGSKTLRTGCRFGSSSGRAGRRTRRLGSNTLGADCRLGSRSGRAGRRARGMGSKTLRAVR